MYRLILACSALILAAAPAAAQERPFLFLTTTAEATKPAARFDYEVGVGESAFRSDVSNQPEQRFGVQASLGRLTFLGRFGFSDVGSSYQSSQSAEALYSLLEPGRRMALAAGGGVLHEAEGVNVLLARVIAGRNTEASRLYGNLVFQKPMATERDAVDLITSVGWARKLSHGLSLGVEALGEDLEGFWDPQEAEGGARLLAGPSLHVSPAKARWQLTATGGPVFHPSDTGRVSSALRDLPPETKNTSYAFRVSLSIGLGADQ
jgi:hypothetical protein